MKNDTHDRRRQRCSHRGSGAALLACTASFPAAAAVINVPLDQPTIQQAISVAVAGDEVVVQPGTYMESIDLLGKAITVRSTNPDDPAIVAATVINGNGAVHVVRCTTGEGPLTIVAGLTVTGGIATGAATDGHGAGMWIAQAAPTVRNCVFAGNTATWGGGMECDGTGIVAFTPSIEGCTFIGNSAMHGGGLHLNEAAAQIASCTFESNQSSTSGGAIELKGGAILGQQPTISACTMHGNSAPSGGAVFGDATTLEISGCRFEDNLASLRGGGMALETSNLELLGCDVVGNSSPNGGGIWANGSTIAGNGSTFAANMAPNDGSLPSSHGGAISIVGGAAVLQSCAFTGNSANEPLGPPADSGAISVDHATIVADTCTFVDNRSASGGGAVNAAYSDATFRNCQFVGNASPWAGALALGSITKGTVTDCTFTGNSAPGPSGSGGVTAGGTNYGQPVLFERCVFESNSATFGGVAFVGYIVDFRFVDCAMRGNSATSGGAVNTDSSGWGNSVDLWNCVLLSNSATDGGGAVSAAGNATVGIRSSTIAGCSAGTIGSAIHTYGGYSPTISASNSILWGNTAPSGGQIAVTAGSASIYSSDLEGSGGSGPGWNAPGVADGGGNIDRDPLFVDPGAGDYRLGTHSRCVDAGWNGAAVGPFDLDGNPRFVDDAGMPNVGVGTPPLIDMGAYERQEDSLNETIRVNPGGSIQAAVDYAISGDEIVVQPGTYTERLVIHGGDLTLRSSGGAVATILDGTGLGTGIMLIDGGSTAATVIEGFTFTQGNACQSGSLNGGALEIVGASPTVRNCVFFANAAWGDGGAVAVLYGANPLIESCWFEANGAAASGGGLAIVHQSAPTVRTSTFLHGNAHAAGGVYVHDGCSPQLVDCDFEGNTGAAGGAMTLDTQCYPTIQSCSFTSNSSTSGGGAIRVQATSRPSILGCTFTSNAATGGTLGGGALYVGSGFMPADWMRVSDSTFEGNSAAIGGAVLQYFDSVQFLRCRFLENTAEEGPGGAICSAGSGIFPNVRLWNSMVVGNTSYEGGGVFLYDGQLDIRQSTLRGNVATTGAGGGGVRNYLGSLSIANSIVWGNSASVGADLSGSGAATTIAFCNVGGCGGSGAGWNPAFGTDGGGNLDLDPLYVDDLGHLAASSPCIEHGSVALASGPEFGLDLDGQPRPIDADLDGVAVPDMGAYELDPATSMYGAVVNQTAHSVHSTFAEAIGDAEDQDVLVGNAAAIAAEPLINLLGVGATLTSFDGWSQPVDGLYVMANGSAIDLGTGVPLDLAGELRVTVNAGVEIVASQLRSSGGVVTVRPQGSLFVDAAQPALLDGNLDLQPLSTAFLGHGASFSGAVDMLASATLESDGDLAFGGPTLLLGAYVIAPNVAIGGASSIYDAVVIVDDAFTNAASGDLAWRGIVSGNMANAGTTTCLGDSGVDGDYLNDGNTVVQLGTLAITGTLTNNGTIVGDVVSGAADATGGPTLPGDGLNIGGGLSADASSALLLPASLWRLTVGGTVSLAIDDPARFAMSDAELRLVAGDASRTLEAMSSDIGPAPMGLDPSGPGRFPLGTLRLAAGAIATVVDGLDNDGAGQSASEAIYASTVDIGPGAQLITNGRTVYYGTLVLLGTVDDPANLVPIAENPGDIDGDGMVTGADLGVVLANWGPCAPSEACPADVTGDGVVDGADLGILLSGWSG